MRINIIGSIILTLVMMLICSVLHLGLFGSIIMMIIVFSLVNNRSFNYKVKNFFRRFRRSRVKALKKASTESCKHRSKHALDRMKL